jgi:arylsulfatase A-like enzyme
MASTLPSHLTLLTGLYPHQHGMSSNRRSASVPFASELGRLSAAVVLRQCGYRTAAFVSAAPLALTSGIQAGFDTYDCPALGTDAARRAAETNARVLEWLDRHAAEPGPLFLWVHYFDPHEPSDPSAPYDTLFRTDERQHAWIRARGIDPAAIEQRYAHSERAERHFFARKTPGQGPRRLGLDDVADLMNRYDGELRYLDDHLGELLDALVRHGLADEALLAVAADHGQSLGENAWLGHGTITNVNTFVPLLVRFPRSLGVAPQRVGALVSLADVLPTLLARFELPGSELLAGQFEGEDVFSGELARLGVLSERTSDVLRDGETGRQVALFSGHWKLIRRPEGRDELYDLAGAGEFVDVLATHRDVAARLAAETDAILARKPALLEDQEGPANQGVLDSLEELGYGGD